MTRRTLDADELRRTDPRGPMVHELKTWPKYFEAVLGGEKTFEVRTFDRDFRVGDVLMLREYDYGAGYSGRFLARRVTYIFDGRASPLFRLDSVCVMAIVPVDIGIDSAAGA